MWKLNEMLVRVTGNSLSVGQSGGLSPAKAGASVGVHREEDSVEKGSVTKVGSGILGPSGDGLCLRKEGFPVFCQLLLGM